MNHVSCVFVCLLVTRMDDNNHHWTIIINQWSTIQHQFMMSYSFNGQTKCSYKWKNKKILRIKGENLYIEPREKKPKKKPESTQPNTHTKTNVVFIHFIFLYISLIFCYSKFHVKAVCVPMCVCVSACVRESPLLAWPNVIIVPLP